MKKVLIIGAGFLQSFVIRKAKEIGYYVLAVDGDKNAVGFKYADKTEIINIVDKESCLEFARIEKIDGVLTAATDYGVLTVSYIARELNLPGLRYDVAELIKNKYRVRKCFYDNHVDDTSQAFEVDEKTNLSEISKKLNYPVMVKPCDGSGSRGASKVDRIEQLYDACQLAMNSSITHRAEIETFIFGKEYGVESLVVDGNIYVLGIMRKWMTEPPYYAELGHAIPNDLSDDMNCKVEQYVKNAIKALGVNFGSVNMDMLITKNGEIHIVDVGARMGGNMIGPCIIPYGTGIEYMENMIRNAAGDKVDLTPKDSCSVCTRLLAFKGGVVKRIPNIEKYEKEYNVRIFHRLEIGLNVNEYHTNLDGLGYIISKSNNIIESINNANIVLEKLSDEIFGE